MMLLCALIFQTVNYWDGPKVTWHGKEDSRRVLLLTQDLNYVAPEYGFDVQTWGASLQKCEEPSAKYLLTKLSYFINFDGDGGVCR